MIVSLIVSWILLGIVLLLLLISMTMTSVLLMLLLVFLLWLHGRWLYEDFHWDILSMLIHHCGLVLLDLVSNLACDISQVSRLIRLAVVVLHVRIHFPGSLEL